jgi:hypothetical protein
MRNHDSGGGVFLGLLDPSKTQKASRERQWLGALTRQAAARLPSALKCVGKLYTPGDDCGDPICKPLKIQGLLQWHAACISSGSLSGSATTAECRIWSRQDG